MTVKKIVTRAQAMRLLRSRNLYEADEWIVDPDEEGTPLDLHRRLSPSVTKQLRFQSKSGTKELCFVSPTELDRQAIRGVRELTRESALLFDRILVATDSQPKTGQLVTVTEDMIPDDAASVRVEGGEGETHFPDVGLSRLDDHEEFGTTEEYLEAFRAIQQQGISENHLRMLLAHLNAPNHTTTWAKLAKSVGYANGNAVNLHYGRFAARVADEMDIDEVPNGFWLDVIAKWAVERDAESGHTAFALRRPVIEALIQLGVFPSNTLELLPDETASGTAFREGSRYQVIVNAYERSSEARRRCIEAHGTTCCICGFNFGEIYGPAAEGFVHIHHLRPLAKVGEDYEVDPVADLRPVCPNCHAVVHLLDPCRSIEEVRRMVEDAKQPSPPFGS